MYELHRPAMPHLKLPAEPLQGAGRAPASPKTPKPRPPGRPGFDLYKMVGRSGQVANRVAGWSSAFHCPDQSAARLSQTARCMTQPQSITGNKMARLGCVSTSPPRQIAQPAHELVGRKLDGDWTVVEKVDRPPSATGGNFSVGYRVQHPDGSDAFLKALDYSKALHSVRVAELLKDMIDSYEFERKVLDECERRRMSRIVRVLAAGAIVDPAFAHVVNYLIFEPADGDVRGALDAMTAFDTAWALSTCHHAAVAVQQLHSGGLAHQDVKPSNLLTFGVDLAKLGDLGRSSKRGTAAPHDEEFIRGDPAYAPPELLYGHVDPDWSVRCQACDLYLLGSLILFVFTKTQTTAEIVRRLPKELRPEFIFAPYSTALPYVVNAFDEVADEFAAQLHGDRAVELVDHFRALCHPDPARRGDPIQRQRDQNPYDLRRIISRLDVLRREARAGYLRKLNA
jgi:serine/threonine protein kinase